MSLTELIPLALETNDGNTDDLSNTSLCGESDHSEDQLMVPIDIRCDGCQHLLSLPVSCQSGHTICQECFGKSADECPSCSSQIKMHVRGRKIIVAYNTRTRKQKRKVSKIEQISVFVVGETCFPYAKIVMRLPGTGYENTLRKLEGKLFGLSRANVNLSPPTNGVFGRVLTRYFRDNSLIVEIQTGSRFRVVDAMWYSATTRLWHCHPIRIDDRIVVMGGFGLDSLKEKFGIIEDEVNQSSQVTTEVAMISTIDLHNEPPQPRWEEDAVTSERLSVWLLWASVVAKCEDSNVHSQMIFTQNPMERLDLLVELCDTRKSRREQNAKNCWCCFCCGS